MYDSRKMFFNQRFIYPSHPYSLDGSYFYAALIPYYPSASHPSTLQDPYH